MDSSREDACDTATTGEKERREDSSRQEEEHRNTYASAGIDRVVVVGRILLIDLQHVRSAMGSTRKVISHRPGSQSQNSSIKISKNERNCDVRHQTVPLSRYD